MDYPSVFPQHAEARVEQARIKAFRDLAHPKKNLKGVKRRRTTGPYGLLWSDAEEDLQNCVLQVWKSFAREAIELCRSGVWTLEVLRTEVYEFLRRLTIEAYHSEGRTRGLRCMTGECGSILPEVMSEYQRSREWAWFTNEMLRLLNARARQPKQVLSVATVQGAPHAAHQADPQKPAERVAKQRREAVNAYIEEVRSKTGKRLTRSDLWRSQRYKSRTEFERWERNDRRATKAAHEKFTRMLEEKPHLK